MSKQDQYIKMFKAQAQAGLLLREGVEAQLEFVEDGSAKKALTQMVSQNMAACAQAAAQYSSVQAEPAVVKITAPGMRFGVICHGPEGSFRKDMVTEHWTTYPVRDMTRKEADDVVAHELTKGTVSTYEIIDLDEQAQRIQVLNAAKKAVFDAVGYDSWPYEVRRGDKGREVRALAIAVGKIAVEAATR